MTWPVFNFATLYIAATTLLTLRASVRGRDRATNAWFRDGSRGDMTHEELAMHGHCPSGDTPCVRCGGPLPPEPILLRDPTGLRAQLVGSPGCLTPAQAHFRGTMKHACWALPLLFLSACGDGKADAAKAQASADSAAAAMPTVIDLVAYDMPLLLTPPDKQLTGGADPIIQWKEETGRLEITVGDHFGMAITEEPSDLTRLKADLERDLLKKNTVVKETQELIIFRSEFPDDPNLVFLHFYRVIAAGSRTFTVQDIDGSQFNEQDVDRMVSSLAPAIPT